MTRSEPKAPVGGAARRAGWNLVDQVVSSVTNAALSFIVARSVDVEQFGGFAVAFSVFALAVGLSRTVATSPLGIRFSRAPAEEFHQASGSATGTAVVLGAAGGAGCLVVAALVGGPAGASLAAVGVVFPALLVQDAWRFVFFAAARPAAAALNDTVWGVVQIAAFAALLASGVVTAWPLVLAWGMAAAVAAVLGARQARVLPRPRRARQWWREHRHLTGYLTGEYVIVQAGHQGALLIIAFVGSLQAIGALRGAQVLLGPPMILAMAAMSFAVPEFSRRRDALDVRGWVGWAFALSGGVALLTFLWGLAFALGPDAVGEALLGQTWPGVDAILWPTILAQVGSALSVGPSAMLIAMARTRLKFVFSLAGAPLMALGGIGGVLLAGAYGAAVGFAAAFWLMVPVTWSLLIYAARHPLRPTTPTDIGEARLEDGPGAGS